MIIYCVINKVNNKTYIGQTIGILDNRWGQHVRFSKTKNGKFANAIRKYGKDNFIPFILWSCDNRKELNFMERFYIKLFGSQNYGYNIEEGGNNSPVAESTKKIISEKKKGNKALLGYKFSKESKKKMSESHKGKIQNVGYKHTEEAKLNMSEAAKRRPPFSAETKRKLSLLKIGNKNGLGYKHTLERRQKISEALKGRTVSEETRKKISETNKKTYKLKQEKTQ